LIPGLGPAERSMNYDERIGSDSTAPEVVLDDVERLRADRSYRDARRAFFAEGVRNVVQAIESGFEVERLIVSERLLTVPIARRLVRERQRSGVPTLRVSPEAFRRVSRTHHASGAAAIIRQRWAALHKASPRAGLCWIVLDAVRSEGNLGSLIRTSEAIGGAGFILVGPGVDPFDPAVVRASMGAVFGQSFVRTNAGSLRNWLRRHRCRAIGASPDGSSELHHFSYRRPTILVLGEERGGLSAALRGLCTDLVRIPMVGKADSLNLAVAGSLLLYEVHRARFSRDRPPSNGSIV
jgi:TrmH family RNA methyltransferase